MLAEGFAGVHIGEVHFNEGNGHGGQGVAQGDAGVRVGGRVDDDEADALLARCRHPLNQGAFVVALERFEINVGGGCPFGKRQIDVSQGCLTVVVGFARPQQIAIGAVQDQQPRSLRAGLVLRRSGFARLHAGQFATDRGILSTCWCKNPWILRVN